MQGGPGGGLLRSGGFKFWRSDEEEMMKEQKEDNKKQVRKYLSEKSKKHSILSSNILVHLK